MSFSTIAAVTFSTYGASLRLLGSPHGSPSISLLDVFVAGCASGFAQSFIASPVELVKTRLQLQGQGVMLPYAKRMGLISCCQHIYKMEGIRGVSRGFMTTLWRDVPSFGVYFVVYEWSRRFLSQCFSSGSNGGIPDPIIVFLAGGTAGAVSWAITYPFDVIKSRIQADGMHGRLAYQGFLHCTVKSIQEVGYGVLTRGMGVCVMRAFPAEGSILLTYEIVLKLLGQNSHV